MHTDREQTTTALSKTFNNLQDLVLFFAVVGMCKICFFNSQRQGFAEFVIVLLLFWFTLFCRFTTGPGQQVVCQESQSSIFQI